MSRTVTNTDSLQRAPTGYSSTYSSYASISSSYPISNGYADSSSTSYCYMTCTTGANASSYLTYTFSISGIPSGSRITSVACKAKARVSSTNYFASATQQLYYYGTAKGSPVSILSTTASERDITDCGTWSYNEVFNVMIRFTGTRGTSSTSSAAYLRIYGATLTIGYEYDETYYEITASSSVQGISALPASQEVVSGGNAVVKITDGTYSVSDNNNDVTSQIVRVREEGTNTYVPNSCTESTFATDSSYPTSNGLSGTISDTYARFRIATTQQHAIYSFDTSAIPSGATILSVSCSVKAYISSTSSNISVKTAQLYAGTTAKGSSTTIPTSNSVWSISSVGSWTYNEIQNIMLRIDCRTSRNQTYYCYFYGADLTISYQTDNYVYQYTISGVSADHTLLVFTPSTGDKVFVKVNGSWVEASSVMLKSGGAWKSLSSVFKKENGSWVEKDKSAIFDPDGLYVKS